MTTAIEIRKAKPEHATEIFRLSDAVQERHAENHPDIFKYPTDISEVEGFFRERICAQDNSIFIATHSDHTVGYVWCTIQKMKENPFKYGRDMIYIHQISVDPKYQRKGVGRKLLEAVGRLAREENIQCLALDTWEFNIEAHSFFEQFGFSRYNINMWRREKTD